VPEQRKQLAILLAVACGALPWRGDPRRPARRYSSPIWCAAAVRWRPMPICSTVIDRAIIAETDNATETTVALQQAQPLQLRRPFPWACRRVSPFDRSGGGILGLQVAPTLECPAGARRGPDDRPLDS